MKYAVLSFVLLAGLAVVSWAPAQEVEPVVAPADSGRSSECLRFAPTDDAVVVTGVVRDSATGVALPGARVTFTWDRGPDRPAGQATTVADRVGRYALCPVPTEIPISLSSTFPRRRAEGVVTLPISREAIRLDFRLSGADAPEGDRPSRITLLETGPGGESAVVTGTVRDEATGAPLVGAQVSVTDLSIGTVSEPGGRFRLPGIPLGEHTIRVEHLGYRSAEESLVVEEVTDFTAVAWLVPQAIALEALEVRARAESGEVARASGDVRYRVTREDFEKRPSATIVEVLRSNIPGIRIGRDRRGCPVLQTRHGPNLIVLDGVPFRDGCILNELNPEVIESVEVLSTAAASTRWGSLGGSGVVEITTRRR